MARDSEAQLLELRNVIAAQREMIATMESQLAESQRMLQTILDSIPVRVFWKDVNLVYQGANRLFLNDMGMSSVDELRGKTDYDITTPEEVEGFRADDRAVMASGQARINFEEHQTRPDGTEGWLRTSKVPLVYEPDNRIVGVLGVYENITDLKLAEQERMRLQEQIIEAQRQALQELSTPIIPIMDGIIVLPLVGSIDTQRARDITRTLLGGISQYRARVAIIDITGVPVVDTGVAQHLNNTIQAARLKGARTIITGISDAVAETIIDLGIDWKGVETLRDLQNGLLVALRQLGYELCQIKS